MNSLTNIHKKVARPLEWLIAAILTIMVLTVGYQVFARYFEALPRMLWTEEIARSGLIWLVALGAAYAFILREHFVIDLISEKFKHKHERKITTVCLAIVTITLTVLLAGSYQFFLTGFKRTSTMTGVSMSWTYLSLLVAFIIMWLASILDLVLHFKRLAPDLSEFEVQEETL